MVDEQEFDGRWEHDPFEAARKRLIQSCRQGHSDTFGTSTKSDNAFYGGALGDGRVLHYVYPCHYNTRWLKNCRVMYSQYVRPIQRKYQPATKAWFDWITGSDSPWKDVFTLGMSEFGSRRQQRLEWMYRFGFLFDKMDVVPANLLQNFLVASRMPKEWPKDVLTWHGYVCRGCTPAASAFFETMFNDREESKAGEWTPNNRYDYPVDHYTSDEGYFVNFCRGRPLENKFSKPFNQCWSEHLMQVEYWPVNCIFGENKLPTQQYMYIQVNKGYAQSVRDRYMDTIGTIGRRPNTNWDGSVVKEAPEIITWRLSFDEQVKVIKEEERRLCLV